jgi:hypothetical protein
MGLGVDGGKVLNQNSAVNLANDSLQADHLNSCQQSLPDFKFAAIAVVRIGRSV